MNGRARTLQRIRAALNDVPTAGAPRDVSVPRQYHHAHHRMELVQLFCQRIADYGVDVQRISHSDLPRAVAGSVDAHNLCRLAAPGGIPQDWLTAVDDERLVRGQPTLTSTALSEVDGVLTGCALGIAESGTVVLDHGPTQGRRAVTVLPDYHLVVAYADQVVADLPDAMARLDPIRPLTFVSGPSATSDIELDRIEGVHGPRTLEVLS